MTTNIGGPNPALRGTSGDYGGRQVMCVHEKLASGNPLREWQSCFGGRWVTAEQAIRHLRRFVRTTTRPTISASESGDPDELNRRLDQLRNRVIYDFVVKRDCAVPCDR